MPIRRRSLNISWLLQLPLLTAALFLHRTNERVLWGLNLELDRKTYNLARLKAMSYDGDGLKALITTSPS